MEKSQEAQEQPASVMVPDQPMIIDLSQILEGLFNNCERKVSNGDLEACRASFKQYFDKCKQLMFGQIDHQTAAEELQKQSLWAKSICAKTFQEGDIVWVCETCSKEEDVILCKDCFNGGNHQGHKARLITCNGGLCDCGDSDALAKEGFCNDHKGYAAIIDNMLENMPTQIKNKAQIVFKHVAYQLKFQSLKLQAAIANIQDHNGNQEDLSQKEKEKRVSMITLLFEFALWSVNLSPALVHFLTEELSQNFIKELNQEESLQSLLKNHQDNLNPQSQKFQGHKCCPIYFLNAQELAIFNIQIKQLILEIVGSDSILQKYQLSQDSYNQSELILKELRLSKGICTCRVLDLIIQVDSHLSDKFREIQKQLHLKLFQSFKFKQILGFTFYSNFEIVLNLLQNEANSLLFYKQALQNDQISLMIVQDEKITSQFISIFTKSIDNFIKTKFTDPSSNNTVQQILIYFQLIVKHDALDYLLNQTNILEQILHIVAQIYYRHQTHRQKYEIETLKKNLYDREKQIISFLKQLFRAVSFGDIERNKKIMGTFISIFKEQRDNMPKMYANHIAMPIHRVFSFFLNRFLMQNYMIEGIQDSNASKNILASIFQKLFDIPNGQNTHQYFESVIESILIPLEMKQQVQMRFEQDDSNDQLKFVQKLFRSYTLLDLSLYQLLIAVSPDPQTTMNLISKIMKIDDIMTDSVQLFKLSDTQEPDQELELHQQLKRLMNVQRIKTFIFLAVTETPILYPLLGNISKKLSSIFKIQSFWNPQIKQFYKNEMKRAIVHCLILQEGCCTFNELREQMDSMIDIYTESELFEETLLELTTRIQDRKGQVQFKLKELKYLNWFDPYYYLPPELLEAIDSAVQNTSLIKMQTNQILGDYKTCFKFFTPIPSIVAETLASSYKLVNLISNYIILWNLQLRGETESIELDEQLGCSFLKLLHIMLKSTKKNNHSQVLMDALTENQLTMINSLVGITQIYEGAPIESACLALLNDIYDLDHDKFSVIEMHALQFKFMDGETIDQFRDDQMEDQKDQNENQNEESANQEIDQ